MWLAGCGPAAVETSGTADPDSEVDSSDVDTDADTDPTTAATVDALGGLVEVAGLDGELLSLEFPEGALAEPTAVVLTALPPEDGEIARFDVSPAGLLALAPITARFEGAEALPAGARFVWLADDVAVDGVVDGSTLVSSLGRLGFVPPEDPARRDLREPSTLVVQAIDCEARILELEFSMSLTTRRGTPEQIIAAWTEIEALRGACEASLLATVNTTACSNYRAREENARAILSNDQDTFMSVAGSLVGAMHSVMLLGAECDVDAFDATLSAEMGELLDAVRLDFSRPSFASDLDAHADALARLAEYHTVCNLHGVSEAVCGRFQSQLFPEVLDLMRSAAYADCRSRSTPFALSQMHADALPTARPVADGGRRSAHDDAEPGDPYLGFARYTYGALEHDAAQCAARLSLRAYDDVDLPVEITDQAAALGGGDAPGTAAVEATVAIPREGTIQVGGPVAAPVCHDGSTDTSALVARVGSTEIARRTRSGAGYTTGTSPFDFVFTQVQAAAGLSEEDTRFDITIAREGATCDHHQATLPLYTVHVNGPAPDEGPKVADYGLVAGGTYAYLSQPGIYDCEEDDDHTETVVQELAAGLAAPGGVGLATHAFDMSLPTPNHFVLSATLNTGSARSGTCPPGPNEGPWVSHASGGARLAVRVDPVIDGTMRVETPHEDGTVIEINPLVSGSAAYVAEPFTRPVVANQPFVLIFSIAGGSEAPDQAPAGPVLDIRMTPAPE